jgi:hypothetical protein
MEKFVPLGNIQLKPPSNLMLNDQGSNHNRSIFSQNKNNTQQSFLGQHSHIQNNQQSNHFLSNESNLLNPNKSIYHDE